MSKRLNSQQIAYRQCFSTDAGKLVLGHLLANGGYFDTDLITEGDIAVQNFVKKILVNMGVYPNLRKDETELKQYIEKLLENQNG